MLKLKNISKVYKSGFVKLVVLRDINLEINYGEFISIMGPSGSGKSTLLQIIGCLDRPTSGEYFFEGRPAEKLSDDCLSEIRNRKIGFVFQFFNLLPHLTVLRNIEFPMIFAGVRSKKQRKITTLNMLHEVGLQDKANFTPSDLSGGQQQRIAIARALINKPALLLADEPTGNLDSKTGEKIVSVLKDLNQKGLTIILSTHDNKIAAQTKRIIHLLDGKIINDEILP